MKKPPIRISYKNEHGSKMFMFGIDDSIPDDMYGIKTYGGANKYPDICPLVKGDLVFVEGTTAFVLATNNGKGMCYVKCSSDSYYKLKARYA